MSELAEMYQNGMEMCTKWQVEILGALVSMGECQVEGHIRAL